MKGAREKESALLPWEQKPLPADFFLPYTLKKKKKKKALSSVQSRPEQSEVQPMTFDLWPINQSASFDSFFNKKWKPTFFPWRIFLHLCFFFSSVWRRWFPGRRLPNEQPGPSKAAGNVSASPLMWQANGSLRGRQASRVPLSHRLGPLTKSSGCGGVGLEGRSSFIKTLLILEQWEKLHAAFRVLLSSRRLLIWIRVENSLAWSSDSSTG